MGNQRVDQGETLIEGFGFPLVYLIPPFRYLVIPWPT